MGILNIEPVSRSGMRFLFSFFGLSETGKTLSALMVASGLEPDPRKRMLIDTEGGNRGRAYEAEIDGGYLYASLSPPYTPERYIQALNEIEAAGVTVLVTDSASHAWFAEGGILQMVEESTNRNDMAKWKEPKRRLGKMMQRYRSSDMHHILCSRAKVPKVEAMVDGRKTYVDGPVMPIQEKMMRYDMTVVAQMLGRGQFTVAAPQGKCPGNLLPIFEASPLMNRETGRRLAEWVKAVHVISPEIRALKVKADEVAGQGAGAFRSFWSGLSRDERDAIKVGLDNYQSMAKAADDEWSRLAAETDEQDQADRERSDTNLDAPFGGSGSLEHVGGMQAQTATVQSAAAPPPRDEAFWAGESLAIRSTSDRDFLAELHKRCREARTADEVDRLRVHNDGIDLLKKADKEQALGWLANREKALRAEAA